jgi:hypothetical protein
MMHPETGEQANGCETRIVITQDDIERNPNSDMLKKLVIVRAENAKRTMLCQLWRVGLIDDPLADGRRAGWEE